MLQLPPNMNRSPMPAQLSHGLLSLPASAALPDLTIHPTCTWTYDAAHPLGHYESAGFHEEVRREDVLLRMEYGLQDGDEIFVPLIHQDAGGQNLYEITAADTEAPLPGIQTVTVAARGLRKLQAQKRARALLPAGAQILRTLYRGVMPHWTRRRYVAGEALDPITTYEEITTYLARVARPVETYTSLMDAPVDFDEIFAD